MASKKVVPKISMNKLKKMLDLSIIEDTIRLSKFCTIEHSPTAKVEIGEKFFTKNMMIRNKYLPESFKENFKLPLVLKSFKTSAAMSKYLKTTKRYPMLIKSDSMYFNSTAASEKCLTDPVVILQQLNSSLNLVRGLQMLKTFHPDAVKEEPVEEAVAAAASATA